MIKQAVVDKFNHLCKDGKLDKISWQKVRGLCHQQYTEWLILRTRRLVLRQLKKLCDGSGVNSSDFVHSGIHSPQAGTL